LPDIFEMIKKSNAPPQVKNFYEKVSKNRSESSVSSSTSSSSSSSSPSTSSSKSSGGNSRSSSPAPSPKPKKPLTPLENLLYQKGGKEAELAQTIYKQRTGTTIPGDVKPITPTTPTTPTTTKPKTTAPVVQPAPTPAQEQAFFNVLPTALKKVVVLQKEKNTFVKDNVTYTVPPHPSGFVGPVGPEISKVHGIDVSQLSPEDKQFATNLTKPQVKKLVESYSYDSPMDKIKEQIDKKIKTDTFLPSMITKLDKALEQKYITKTRDTIKKEVSYSNMLEDIKGKDWNTSTVAFQKAVDSFMPSDNEIKQDVKEVLLNAGYTPDVVVSRNYLKQGITMSDGTIVGSNSRNYDDFINKIFTYQKQYIRNDISNQVAKQQKMIQYGAPSDVLTYFGIDKTAQKETQEYLNNLKNQLGYDFTKDYTRISRESTSSEDFNQRWNNFVQQKLLDPSLNNNKVINYVKNNSQIKDPETGKLITGWQLENKYGYKFYRENGEVKVRPMNQGEYINELKKDMESKTGGDIWKKAGLLIPTAIIKGNLGLNALIDTIFTEPNANNLVKNYYSWGKRRGYTIEELGTNKELMTKFEADRQKTPTPTTTITPTKIYTSDEGSPYAPEWTGQTVYTGTVDPRYIQQKHIIEQGGKIIAKPTKQKIKSDAEKLQQYLIGGTDVAYANVLKDEAQLAEALRKGLPEYIKEVLTSDTLVNFVYVPLAATGFAKAGQYIGKLAVAAPETITAFGKPVSGATARLVKGGAKVTLGGLKYVGAPAFIGMGAYDIASTLPEKEVLRVSPSGKYYMAKEGGISSAIKRSIPYVTGIATAKYFSKPGRNVFSEREWAVMKGVGGKVKGYFPRATLKSLPWEKPLSRFGGRIEAFKTGALKHKINIRTARQLKMGLEPRVEQSTYQTWKYETMYKHPGLKKFVRSSIPRYVKGTEKLPGLKYVRDKWGRFRTKYARPGELTELPYETADYIMPEEAPLFQKQFAIEQPDTFPWQRTGIMGQEAKFVFPGLGSVPKTITVRGKPVETRQISKDILETGRFEAYEGPKQYPVDKITIRGRTIKVRPVAQSVIESARFEAMGGPSMATVASTISPARSNMIDNIIKASKYDVLHGIPSSRAGWSPRVTRITPYKGMLAKDWLYYEYAKSQLRPGQKTLLDKFKSPDIYRPPKVRTGKVFMDQMRRGLWTRQPVTTEVSPIAARGKWYITDKGAFKVTEFPRTPTSGKKIFKVNYSQKTPEGVRPTGEPSWSIVEATTKTEVQNILKNLSVAEKMNLGKVGKIEVIKQIKALPPVFIPEKKPIVKFKKDLKFKKPEPKLLDTMYGKMTLQDYRLRLLKEKGYDLKPPKEIKVKPLQKPSVTYKLKTIGYQAGNKVYTVTVMPKTIENIKVYKLSAKTKEEAINKIKKKFPKAKKIEAEVLYRTKYEQGILKEQELKWKYVTNKDKAKTQLPWRHLWQYLPKEKIEPDKGPRKSWKQIRKEMEAEKVKELSERKPKQTRSYEERKKALEEAEKIVEKRRQAYEKRQQAIKKRIAEIQKMTTKQFKIKMEKDPEFADFVKRNMPTLYKWNTPIFKAKMVRGKYFPKQVQLRAVTEKGKKKVIKEEKTWRKLESEKLAKLEAQEKEVQKYIDKLTEQREVEKAMRNMDKIKQQILESKEKLGYTFIEPKERFIPPKIAFAGIRAKETFEAQKKKGKKRVKRILTPEQLINAYVAEQRFEKARQQVQEAMRREKSKQKKTQLKNEIKSLNLRIKNIRVLIVDGIKTPAIIDEVTKYMEPLEKEKLKKTKIDWDTAVHLLEYYYPSTKGAKYFTTQTPKEQSIARNVLARTGGLKRKPIKKTAREVLKIDETKEKPFEPYMETKGKTGLATKLQVETKKKVETKQDIKKKVTQETKKVNVLEKTLKTHITKIKEFRQNLYKYSQTHLLTVQQQRKIRRWIDRLQNQILRLDRALIIKKDLKLEIDKIIKDVARAPAEPPIKPTGKLIAPTTRDIIRRIIFVEENITILNQQNEQASRLLLFLLRSQKQASKQNQKLGEKLIQIQEPIQMQFQAQAQPPLYAQAQALATTPALDQIVIQEPDVALGMDVITEQEQTLIMPPLYRLKSTYKRPYEPETKPPTKRRIPLPDDDEEEKKKKIKLKPKGFGLGYFERKYKTPDIWKVGTTRAKFGTPKKENNKVPVFPSKVKLAKPKTTKLKAKEVKKPEFFSLI